MILVLKGYLKGVMKRNFRFRFYDLILWIIAYWLKRGLIFYVDLCSPLPTWSTWSTKISRNIRGNFARHSSFHEFLTNIPRVFREISSKLRRYLVGISRKLRQFGEVFAKCSSNVRECFVKVSWDFREMFFKCTWVFRECFMRSSQIVLQMYATNVP